VIALIIVISFCFCFWRVRRINFSYLQHYPRANGGVRASSSKPSRSRSHERPPIMTLPYPQQHLAPPLVECQAIPVFSSYCGPAATKPTFTAAIPAGAVVYADTGFPVMSEPSLPPATAPIEP
jgi:hypothetical protein